MPFISPFFTWYVWGVPKKQDKPELDRLARKWGLRGGAHFFDGIGLGDWSRTMSDLEEGVVGDPESQRQRDEIGEICWEHLRHSAYDGLELRHQTHEATDEVTDPFRGPGDWVEGSPYDPYEPILGE